MERLYQSVLAELLDAVVTGELAAASPLPGERAIAERFACSRGVAREAIRALEERGIVEVVSGRGQRVLTDDRWHLLDREVAAATLVRHRDPVLLREAVEAARLVETRVAILAAERRTAADLARFGDALEQLRRGNAGAEADFHRTLALTAGNRFLATALDPLHAQLAAARRLRAPQRHPVVVRAHETVLAALRAADPDAAAAAIDGYWRRVAGWI